MFNPPDVLSWQLFFNMCAPQDRLMSIILCNWNTIHSLLILRSLKDLYTSNGNVTQNNSLHLFLCLPYWVRGRCNCMSKFNFNQKNYHNHWAAQEKRPLILVHAPLRSPSAPCRFLYTGAGTSISNSSYVLSAVSLWHLIVIVFSALFSSVPLWERESQH